MPPWRVKRHVLQRPFGGVACSARRTALRKTVRGPLEGAGQWTHQYADPANTCCSSDILVQGKLGILWFRDSDLESPVTPRPRLRPRCSSTAGSSSRGSNALRAVDAYNGRMLWEYPLPGVLKPYHGEHLVGDGGDQQQLLRQRRRRLRPHAATAACGSTPRPARSSASSPPRPSPTASRCPGASSPASLGDKGTGGPSVRLRWPTPSMSSSTPMARRT